MRYGTVLKAYAPLLVTCALSWTLTRPVPQFSLRRTAHRCHHCDKSSCTSTRRQLWRMGWSIQHIRLRSQGRAEEGGPLERHHRRVLDGWLARRTWRLQADAQRRDLVRHSPRRYRRRQHRVQQNDGRQHKARGATNAASISTGCSFRCRRHGRGRVNASLPCRTFSRIGFNV